MNRTGPDATGASRDRDDQEGAGHRRGLQGRRPAGVRARRLPQRQDQRHRRAAAWSPASFYNYYDTKADLLIALAEEFHAEATSLAALPFQAGLARPEALREAVAGVWRTYAKRRGELIGIFQAAMVEGRFRDRWLELRGEAINRIAGEVRAAQAHGYCPGVDPVMTASALSAMLEHFCYIWLGQGGEKDVPFDDERALDAVATIWQKAIYWRAEPG